MCEMICQPCSEDQRKTVVGHAFTKYECRLCEQEYEYHNTNTPNICPSCAIRDGLCQRCGQKEFREAD